MKAKEKFLQTENIKVQILYGRRKDEKFFLSLKECLQEM